MAGITRSNPGGIQESQYVRPIPRPDRRVIAPGGGELHADQAQNIQTKSGIDASRASSAQPLGRPVPKPLDQS
jgi:hypothetical protein